jgi:hypothetical protein
MQIVNPDGKNTIQENKIKLYWVGYVRSIPPFSSMRAVTLFSFVLSKNCGAENSLVLVPDEF